MLACRDGSSRLHDSTLLLPHAACTRCYNASAPPPPPPQGLELRKKAFFANIGAILTFAVLGTFVSALTFGLATYGLVLLGIVRRGHLAGSPLVECLL